MNRKCLPILLVASALSACTVGPQYKKPEVSTPPAYSDVNALPTNAVTQAEAGLRTWWMQFGDPELSSLIARAIPGNLDLKTAISRIREAREEEIVAGATALPKLNADADVNHTHISQNSGLSQLASLFGGGAGGGSGSGFALPGGGFTTYTVGFDASWEIDAFGGTRRAVEAAEAKSEQAIWTSRDSEVTVAAEVAGDYLMLRGLQRQIAVARDEIGHQQQILELVRARRKFGFVTALDVRQQEAQLSSARAMLPDLDADASAQVHALGVLLGVQPEALESELAAPEVLPTRVPTVPVGLPSDLLRRRPDIRAAERALAAYNAQIGVAVADLYPKFNLTGAFDFVSLDLKHLLDLSSRQYSGTAAITWPILAGGQIHANIRAAKQENLQALYAYQKAVIAALQDVEDALTRYGDEQKKNAALRETLKEAGGAADIAVNQYKAGLTDFTPVLNAQGAVLSAQNELVASDSALDRDVVSLYKALGGGWKESGPPVRAGASWLSQ
ncbi:MAG TPA: efflux transporter outer membrane subunit [Rhizomicrobium sp.]|jgi:NodT family efflux transporter outer membrane factor (OMF) lipoprotein